MISLKNIIVNSNHFIKSFKLLTDVGCLKQIDDFNFENIDYILKIGDVYDGEIVFKRNNQLYLSLGYDKNVNCNIFIPVFSNSGEILIEIHNSN